MRPHFNAPRARMLIVALVALLGGSLLVVTNAPRARACPVCISPDKITLSGDGVTGVAIVTDPGLLAWFSASQFMGFETRTPIAAPTPTGSGIELTRYYQNTGVPPSFWTQGFDHMRYYPGAAGQSGYIFYEGPVSAEARTYGQGLAMWSRIGQWYALSANEQDEMDQLLAAAHVSQPDSAASNPVRFTSQAASNDPPPLAMARAFASLPLPVALLLACLALFVAGAILRLLYVRRHPRAFSPVEQIGD